MRIETGRMTMIAADLRSVSADLAGRERLTEILGVSVPEDWPPELYDAGAMQESLKQLRDPKEAGWALWYLVPKNRVPVLAGVAGYKGKPRDGSVEIGYSLLAAHRRKGYATDAVRALVERAFGAGVETVIAETLPNLDPSIAVLERCGFKSVGEGSESGVIRYALDRDGR